MFLESPLLTFVYVDFRATCFVCAHPRQRTEDWNYDNSEERVHYATRVQPGTSTQTEVMQSVMHSNFFGCCPGMYGSEGILKYGDLKLRYYLEHEDKPSEVCSWESDL